MSKNRRNTNSQNRPTIIFVTRRRQQNYMQLMDNIGTYKVDLRGAEKRQKNSGWTNVKSNSKPTAKTPAGNVAVVASRQPLAAKLGVEVHNRGMVVLFSATVIAFAIFSIFS